MKTFNKKLFLALLTVGILFGSCTDLTEKPYDNLLTEEDIQNGDPAILDALTAPVYTRLTDVLYGWHGYFDLIEESSDVIVTPARPNGWVDGGTYRALHMHTWNSFQSQPGGLWNRCYAALNILNNAIFTYKSMDGTENLVAELRSLRALYYYLLLDSFGNIPVTTEDDIGKEGFLPEQSTRLEAFTFIEGELLEIMPLLNEAKVYGKMNKWAAKMILAKLYLNAEVYTGTARWTDAIDQVDDIIESGLYELENNYHANFAVVNEGSREQIFSVIFDKTRSGWFHYPWKTLHPASRATYNFTDEPWGGSCAIPQFIDTYDTEDARFNIWIRGPQFASDGSPIYNSFDPALTDVQLDYTKQIGDVDGTKEYEGYRVGKFEIEKGVSGYAISNDVPLFRYADALMIKAEALLRTGQGDAAATIVTEIRTRAFAATNPSKAAVTGAQLAGGSTYNYGRYKDGVMLTTEGGADIQYGRFLDELGYEFAAEFHRRQDLIRFGVFTSKSWLTHVPNGSHRILYDIPQAALDANPNLDHNPGYN